MSAYSSTQKIMSLPTALSRIAGWRVKGRRIVCTNGCFDLVHPGHVQYLEAARALGDHLVVGLNSDRSVRALKGAQRPIVDEQGRARVLAGLEAIDAVVFFDTETPLALIQAIQPDVLVKGGDYTLDTIVGAAEVLAGGGSVEVIPFLPGYSTSDMIAQIQDFA